MGGITWLHLSDWHQTGKESDRQVLLDGLLNDIKSRTSISPDLAKIDFIVFSGDVAFSGKAKEFMLAKDELFDPLLKVSELSPHHLFIVPGNHDIDRTSLKVLSQQILRPLEQYDEKSLNDHEKMKLFLKPFQDFTDFVTSYTGQESPAYASIRKLQIRGKKIVLLGLNSALMSGKIPELNDNILYSRCMLTKGQKVYDFLDGISDADLKIAVFHHPIDWLAELDRSFAKGVLSGKFDFVLHGHQHRLEQDAVRSSSGDFISIFSGFGYKNFDDTYNFVHLDFNTGKCTIFIRRWSDLRNKWIGEYSSRLGEKLEFDLPRSNKRLERSRQIRSILLDLASRDAIPDEILVESLKIINLRLDQLNYRDRMKDELLDRLFYNDKNVDTFIDEWMKTQAYQPSPTNLRLIKVKLENIRCFETIKISLQESNNDHALSWIMLLGDNATGKTTLLRSIAIGLCNESDATTLMRKLPGDFIRKGKSVGFIKLTLIDEVSKKRYLLTTIIEKRKGSESEVLRKIIKPKIDFPWNELFICGYGPNRSGLADASYDGYYPIHALSTLFDLKASLQNPEVVLLKAGDLYDELSRSLLGILMLDDSGNKITLPKDSQHNTEIEGPWGKISINSLSEGYRSTLQWLLDFLGWAIYAGRLGNGRNIGGILLIDELEQHLHPKWQRYIVQRLQEKLPGTQLIATTHTPLIAAAISDMSPSGLIKLDYSSEKKTVEARHINPARLHGKRADQILTEVFGLTTSRTLGSQEDISLYAELLSKGNKRTAEDNIKLQELSNKIKEEHTSGENAYEQEVEKAVHKVLENQLHSPVDLLYSSEVKHQLRQLLGK
jgi:predicted ATP-binding protein involved in virulence/predicted phosphodiesterase